MENLPRFNSRIGPISFFILVTAVTFWLMYYGQSIIIPLVIAVAIFYLINEIADNIQSIKVGRFSLSRRAAIAITLILLIFGIVALGRMFTNTILSITSDLAQMEGNINRLLEAIPNSIWLFINDTLNIELSADIGNLYEIFAATINRYIAIFASQVASLTVQTFLVIVYIIFITIEQGAFLSKVALLTATSERAAEIEGILSSINKEIQAYITVKTWISLIVGAISYVVMLLFGLQNALFWAVLIYLLNYIPYVGSIVAVAFPVLFSLAQFGSWPVFLGLLGTLFVVQMLVGYIIEPMMMGSSLGISPIVVLVSLSLFNLVWGITGMLLSIPLVIVIIIVLSHFDTTRPISILLSSDGNVYGIDLEKKELPTPVLQSAD